MCGVLAMTNDQKNDMEMMVLTDLARICKKLADTPGFPEALRTQAREFGDAYDSLLPTKVKEPSLSMRWSGRS